MAVGVDHIVYGWIFFAVVTALLLGIGMTFRETDGDNAVYMPAAADRLPGRRSGRQGVAAALAACVAVALSGPAYADYMLHRGVSQTRPVLAAPASVGEWRAVTGVTTDWRPTFVGPDAETIRTYRRVGREVHLYLAYYTHQRQGAELVNSSNTFVQERSWERASSGMDEAKIGDTALSVQTVRLIGQGRNHGRGRVVWQWYWIGDRYTSDPLVAKIRQAQARLFGTSQAAAAIVVATDYEDNPAEAIETLGDFAADLKGLAGSLAKTVRN